MMHCCRLNHSTVHKIVSQLHRDQLNSETLKVCIYVVLEVDFQLINHRIFSALHLNNLYQHFTDHVKNLLSFLFVSYIQLQHENIKYVNVTVYTTSVW